jgi:hypothetical protein
MKLFQLAIFFWSLPFWLPVVWAAYVIGSGRYSLRMLLGLVGAEAVAIALALWLPPIFLSQLP